MRRTNTETPSSLQRRKSWFQNSTFANLFTGQRSPPRQQRQQQQQQQEEEEEEKEELPGQQHQRFHHSTPPPPPPLQRHNRSRSLDVTYGAMSNNSSPQGGSPHSSHHYPSPGKIVSIIHRAKRHGLKRLPTASDLRQLNSKLSSGTAPLPANTHENRAPLDAAAAATATATHHGESRATHRNATQYLLSTGEEEAERIQLKNDLIKLAFEGEFALPIDFHKIEHGRVLDVGCGPGHWCFDLAQDYPRLHVIGVDNVNMFPDPSSVPANCELIKYNVLDGLTHTLFPEASFDCIHIRFMCLAFTREQYSQVIDDCWRLLKPGGYLEILEMDMMVYSPGPATERLNLQVVEAARSRGLKPRLAREITLLIPKNAVNRLEKYRSLPIGIWGGRLGVLMREDLSHVLSNSHAAVNEYNRAHGKSVDEKLDIQTFQSQLAVALKELEQYHSYSNFHIIIVQKPEEEREQRSPPPPPPPPTTTTATTSTSTTTTTAKTSTASKKQHHHHRRHPLQHDEDDLIATQNRKHRRPPS